SRIVVRHDRTPAFGDFGGAVVAADDTDIAADRAQVLVVTALGAGPQRAASPLTRSLTPWPNWASTPPGCVRRRWSPAGWPSSPPRRQAGARCW
ncbi:MAG TPA: hypothetical protein VG673_02620, partial [Actinomycetota bacterium]|nr:hypothetical protein [Actinomycetota bacterium]